MTALLLAAMLAQSGEMALPAGAVLDPRPPAAQLSPIQRHIDTAPPGSTVEIGPGTYEGDLFIDRSIRLVGRGWPLLVGSGRGSVVMIRADGVTFDGFVVDGRGGGDLGRDASGIHVAAPRASIRNCEIRNTLFGVYLREAPGSRVEHCRIRGIVEKTPGEKGSGIHVWNTDGFEITGNDITDVRDGLYIQSSPNGLVRGNVARDLRYGLHYMFSDDNVFEDNVFENGDAGAALMYSRRLAFRRNQFLRNRGFASVGLLLKACDDVIAEDNLIADNARGIFLEGTIRNTLRGNSVVGSDVAIVLYDSSAGTVIAGNSFVDNLAPLALSGRRTDALFDGNYWSDNDALDLDGDGVTDQPHRLTSLFDHMRGNMTAADLLSRSLSASAVAAAERALPVLAPATAVDRAPLARPPALRTPQRARRDERAAPLGLLASAAAFLAGLAAIVSRRPALSAPAERRRR